MRLFRNPVHTHCECKGVELDVAVNCDYQPPELHVAEDLEITAIWYEDQGDIIDELLDHELEALRMRLLEGARYYGIKARTVKQAFADQARTPALRGAH